MQAVPADILRFIHDHEAFFVIGHIEPDGDCIGAQLSLVSLLKRLGKEAHALQDGPFDRPETESFAALFTTQVPAISNKKAAVVVVDCSTPGRVSDRYKKLLELPVLVIDHHAAGEPFGALRFADSRAASTTVLIVRLCRALGETPTKAEAKHLFFGLATDTGFFRHCESGCAEVFDVALFCIENGASPKQSYQTMYGNRSFAQRRLLGKLLSKAESLFDGKLILTWQTLAERGEAGPSVRSSEELYSLFQTVKGVEVIVFLREEKEGLTSVGLRSMADIDVAALAALHGGGGHKLASGFNFTGDLADAKKLVLAEFEKIFSS